MVWEPKKVGGIVNPVLMLLGIAWLVLSVEVQQNLVLNPFFSLFRVLTTALRAAPGRSELALCVCATPWQARLVVELEEMNLMKVGRTSPG